MKHQEFALDRPDQVTLTPSTPEQLRAAALTVAENASDIDDVRWLLAALGYEVRG